MNRAVAALAVVLTLSLAACQMIEPYKLKAYQDAKDTSDQLLQDALVVACDASTHGAVKRRFPTAEARAEFDAACAKALGRDQ